MIPKLSAGSLGRRQGRTSPGLGTWQVFLNAAGPELSQEAWRAGSRLLYWVLANYCPDQDRKQCGTQGSLGGRKEQWQERGQTHPTLRILGLCSPEPSSRKTTLVSVTGRGFLKTICTSHSWPTTAAPNN